MGRKIGGIVEITQHDDYTEYEDISTVFPPPVDADDNGNILKVVDGKWSSGLPSSGVLTKIAEKDFEVSTTSSTDIDVGIVECGTGIISSEKMVYVQIRDLAGPRAGYYYGSNVAILNPYPINEAVGNVTSLSKYLVKVNSDGKIVVGNYTSNYGVTVAALNADGTIVIKARYGESSSTIIDGKFKVKVYLLDFPEDLIPFIKPETPETVEQGDE